MNGSAVRVHHGLGAPLFGSRNTLHHGLGAPLFGSTNETPFIKHFSHLQHQQNLLYGLTYNLGRPGAAPQLEKMVREGEASEIGKRDIIRQCISALRPRHFLNILPEDLSTENRREIRSLLFAALETYGKKAVPHMLSEMGWAFRFEEKIDAMEHAEKIELAVVAAALGDRMALDFLILSHEMHANPRYSGLPCSQELSRRAIVGLGDAYVLAKKAGRHELAGEFEKTILSMERLLGRRHYARQATNAMAKLELPPDVMIREFEKGNFRAAPALSKLGSRGFDALLAPFTAFDRRINRSVLGAAGDLLIFSLPALLAGSLFAAFGAIPEPYSAPLFGGAAAAMAASLHRGKLAARCGAAISELKNTKDAGMAGEAIKALEGHFKAMWEPAAGSVRGFLTTQLAFITLLFPLHQPALRASATGNLRLKIVKALEDIAERVPEKKGEVLESLGRMNSYLLQPLVVAFGFFLDLACSMGGALGKGPYEQTRNAISAAIAGIKSKT